MSSDVFVLGSLHLDVVVDTPSLPRIDETVMGQSVAYRFGGKGGNQAVAAARLGAKTAMAGRVGMDPFGDRLLEVLDAEGVVHDQVLRVPGASGMSVAIVNADGDYGAVVVSGVNQANTGTDIALPPETRVLVLQNEVPEAANLALVEKAGAATRVLLNAAPARPIAARLLERVAVLVVNRLEAAMLIGQEESLASPNAAAERLLELGPEAVVVTLGGEGCVGAVRGGTPFRMPAYKVPVVSTHGAGDMFVGALAARLADGKSLDAAIALAQGAAALYVSLPFDRRASGLTLAAVRQFVEGAQASGGSSTTPFLRMKQP